ncbi:MAG: terminase family protein [Candidatus Bathyarchaeia archaeon]
MSKQIEVYYEPRPAFLPFHARQERWACIVFHRRGGKTVGCINDIHTRALYTGKKNARYAYIAPFYRQAKDVAWMYLKDATQDSAVKVKESELSVELFNGAKITLYGADNPDALRGLYLDGVILDEFGDCRPSLWGEVVLPTLADRKGWAVFIGTPKGKNHFWQVRERAKREKNWFYLEVKASDPGCVLPQEELDEMRAQMSEAQYEQELECSFEAAVLGTYYAKQISLMEAGRIDGKPGEPQIGVYKHDVDFPVQAAQDIGYSDSNAIWFWQHRPDGIAIIDYEEHHGEALPFYFELLRNKPYDYETIWLPHDAKAKSLQTGRTTVEQYLNEVDDDGNSEFPIRIAPRIDVQHGIDAVRFILPHCYIDQANCGDGIEALRAYRRRYDEITKAFSPKPLHDWSSNGADAFRYFALVAKEKIETRSIHQIVQQQHYKPPGMTLEALFHDRAMKKPRFNRQRV